MVGLGLVQLLAPPALQQGAPGCLTLLCGGEKALPNLQRFTDVFSNQISVKGRKKKYISVESHL